MGSSSIARASAGMLCCWGLSFSVEKANAQLASEDKAEVQIECDRQQIFTAKSCAGDGLEPEEKRLYDLVNQYRVDNGLPPIALSPSLNLVANRHVLDLDKNIGTLTHSWSNCPYSASNRATYSCMWKSPQRLGTAYPGYGYENAYKNSRNATAADAIRAWKNSSSHREPMLNQRIWRNKHWKAMGVGIHRGYAVLWFGEQADPLAVSRGRGGAYKVCRATADTAPPQCVAPLFCRIWG
ncbi:MAG: CAP domain-containing protein [Cyanosarcina radialis HA8281-LM2]|jgi:uncharacterized protein YkwD|nr:CAP domain-containing protein [Cyanosarcina radialis HA8281-LM2]